MEHVIGKQIHTKSRKEIVDFDEAICLTGYGKFHYEILFVSAMSIISIGFQNGILPYIFPSAQCELKLTSSQLGFLNVSFLIGGTISSFMWGILADTYGRRNILTLTHLLNAIITIVFACSYFMSSLIICRFLNGFLISGPGSIIFSYLGEFQPSHFRSSIICYSGLFFTLSWLLLPLLAGIILPLNFYYSFHSVIYISPWRIFLIIVIIPEIIAGLWFMQLPESPKYLVARENIKEALNVLQKIYVKNTGNCLDQFPVKNLCNNKQMKVCFKCSGKVVKIFTEILTQFKKLFRPPLLFITLLTSTIMYTNMFGAFGLGLWLPELFNKFQQFQALYPNKTVSIQKLALLNQIKIKSCQPSFDSTVIQNTVVSGIISLIANALSGWFARRVSMKTIPFIVMLSGGLSALSIYWLKSSIEHLIMASIFQATMLTANMSIGSVTVELFPTQVGAMAMSTVMCAGRLGAMTSNLTFAFLIDKHCEIPIFLVAVNVLIGALLCFIIPIQKVDEDLCINRNHVNERQIQLSVISNFDTKL